MITATKNGFSAVLGRCFHIVTAIKPAEAALLYHYAQKCDPGKNILEIGADKGFSTCLLAETGRQVITIDPHMAATYHDHETGTSGSHTEDDFKQFLINTARYDNITHHRTHREDAPDVDHIGFIFIDANHAWPHPKLDYLHFIDEIQPGTYGAWHDYGTFPGVTRAIERLIEEKRVEFIENVATMAITRAI